MTKSYEENCLKLFPLATAFRPESPPPIPLSGVKEVAAKNISASGGGVVVLKETALSSAAMSDLSGDINEISSTSQKNLTDDEKLNEAISSGKIKH